MSQLGTTKQVAAEWRQRLSGLQGRRYWRSLEELAQSDEFERIVEGEFPGAASLLSNGLSRREFTDHGRFTGPGRSRRMR